MLVFKKLYKLKNKLTKSPNFLVDRMTLALGYKLVEIYLEIILMSIAKISDGPKNRKWSFKQFGACCCRHAAQKQLI